MITLDEGGVIRSALGGREFANESLNQLVGRVWTDTVSQVTREKAELLLDEASASGVTGFRHVDQEVPRGVALPVEYAAVRHPGDRTTLLIGRDLRGLAELQRRYLEAQQTLERDYWKLRQVETRYRILFHSSSEEAVVVGPESFSILDANPAARRLMGLDGEQGLSALVGRTLLSEVATEDREVVRGYLEAILRRNEAMPVRARIGPAERPSLVRASASRDPSGVSLFVRFTPWDDDVRTLAIRPSFHLDALMAHLPDAFVVVDEQGLVGYANQAFGDLVQVAPDALIGRPVHGWLARPGADWTVIRSILDRHGVVRLFSTSVVGDAGLESETELSAARVETDAGSRIGIVLRGVNRRIEGGGSSLLYRSLEELEGRVGKTTLKSLVAETKAVVERHFIVAALPPHGRQPHRCGRVAGGQPPEPVYEARSIRHRRPRRLILQSP